MKLNGSMNKPINIWEAQKRASKKELNDLGGKKLTAKPTKEQLDSLTESQKREQEYLKDNSLIVPIDWDYVKETINLTDEERKIRDRQDKLELDISFYSKMSEIENDYQKNIAEIDANAEENQKKIDAQNKAKAEAIINKIAKGLIVSPFDMAFVNDVSPEKLSKALKKADELKNDSKYNNSQNLSRLLMSSLDYKI